jgi:hypothetical protein
MQTIREVPGCNVPGSEFPGEPSSVGPTPEDMALICEMVTACLYPAEEKKTDQELVCTTVPGF